MSVDPERNVVRVSGGVRYGELARYLDSVGYALHNTASLPHISVAGSVATATHGSGDANQNLAAAVRAIDLVTASGELITLAQGADDDFAGAVAGLGSLGIVSTLELEIVPSFQVRQWVYEGLPSDAVTGSFEEIFGSAYSVSVFTDWTGGNNRIWQKARVDGAGAAGGGGAGGGRGDGAPSWLGARLADGPRNPVPGMSAGNATEQLGGPGPWHERLPHFRLEFTPSAGAELQSEYLVAREVAVPAIQALFALRPPDLPRPPDRRNPHQGRRRPVAQHGVRARHGGLPLHLGPGRCRGRPGAGGHRGGPGPVRGAAALGQGVLHAAGRGAGAVPAVRRLR